MLRIWLIWALCPPESGAAACFAAGGAPPAFSSCCNLRAYSSSATSWPSRVAARRLSSSCCSCRANSSSWSACRFCEECPCSCAGSSSGLKYPKHSLQMTRLGRAWDWGGCWPSKGDGLLEMEAAEEAARAGAGAGAVGPPQKAESSSAAHAKPVELGRRHDRGIPSLNGKGVPQSCNRGRQAKRTNSSGGAPRHRAEGVEPWIPGSGLGQLRNTPLLQSIN
eukprot:GGOE01008029.1.p3 GENE.GGOE01008029.1~~GGOE01008029.1.p3  ORF type:complete len:222 (-),score=15.47 GGOE01008029.1:793-1458(-)